MNLHTAVREAQSLARQIIVNRFADSVNIAVLPKWHMWEFCGYQFAPCSAELAAIVEPEALYIVSGLALEEGRTSVWTCAQYPDVMPAL